jgi:hypothetical protein
VRRAIKRDPIDEDAWPYEENTFRMVPCLFISTLVAELARG